MPSIFSTLDRLGRSKVTVNKDFIETSINMQINSCAVEETGVQEDEARVSKLSDWHALIDSILTQMFLRLDFR